MADPDRKRSRKSRLVPRDPDLDTDIDTPKTSTLQVLSRLNSAMAKEQEPSDTSNSEMAFNVEVECEEMNEPQQQQLLARLNYIQKPAYVLTADLRNETEELFKITTSTADKILEVELRNSWGRHLKAPPLSQLDTALQNVFLMWRQWNAQSRCRTVPLLYKCYSCDVGFWHLYPFKDHLQQNHPSIYVHHESFHHEFNVIAWTGDREMRPKIKTVGIMGGNCGMCLSNHKVHISQYRASITYNCLGCKEKFFTCPTLFGHEGKCQRFLQHMVNQGNVIHENRWICSICNIDCLTEQRYNNHMVGRHSVRNDTVIGTPLHKVCLFCNTKYFIHNLHACHVKPMTYQCEYCNRKFHNKFLLNHHLETTSSPTRCRTCDHFIPRICMEVAHVIQHSSTYSIAYQCLCCPDTLVFPTDIELSEHLGRVHKFKGEKKRGFKQLVIVPQSVRTLPQLPWPTCDNVPNSLPSPELQPQVMYTSFPDSHLEDNEELEPFQVKSEIKIEEHDIADQMECAVAALESVRNDDQQCSMMDSEINVLLSEKRKCPQTQKRTGKKPRLKIGPVIIDDTEPTQIKKEREDSVEERVIEIRDSIEEECGLLEGEIEEMFKQSVIAIKEEDTEEKYREDSIERECREMQNHIDSLLKQKNGKITNKEVEVKTEDEEDEECELIQEEIDSLIKQKDNKMKEKHREVEADKSDKTNILTRLLHDDVDDNELFEGLEKPVQPHKKTGLIEDTNDITNDDDITIESTDINDEESHVTPIVDVEIKCLTDESDELHIDEAALENVRDHDYLTSTNVDNGSKNDAETTKDDIENSNDSDCDDDLIILNSDGYNFIDLTEDDDDLETNESGNHVQEGEITNASDDKNTNENNDKNTNASDDKKTNENNDKNTNASDDKNIDESNDKSADECHDNAEAIYKENPDNNEFSLRRLYHCGKCDFVGVHRAFATHKRRCKNKIQRVVKISTSEPGKEQNEEKGMYIKRELTSVRSASKDDAKPSGFGKWSKFQCSRCQAEYKTLGQYLSHVCKLPHEVTADAMHNFKPRQCPKCMRYFANAQKLNSHVVSHIRSSFVSLKCITKSSSENGTDGIFQCKVCQSPVSNFDFFQHWEAHLILDRVRRNSARRAPTKIETVDGDTITKIVKQEPIDGDTLTEMMKQEPLDGDTGNTSKSVKEEFKEKLKPDLLRLVLKQLQSTKFTRFDKLKRCGLCQRKFHRRNDCKRHLIEHLLRDAYQSKIKNDGLQCQICGEIHRNVDGYKRHMRGHGSLPVFSCELCDKDFSDSSNFTKHKKVHNLDVVVCDICTKKFQHKASLIKHMEIHATLAPMQCSYCHKVFTLPTALKKHIKMSHAAPGSKYFSCIYCRQRFPTLRFKWDHMWEVHKERKHQADCPKCGRSFRKLQDVNRHIKEVHWRSLPCLIPAGKAARNKTKTQTVINDESNNLVYTVISPDELNPGVGFIKSEVNMEPVKLTPEDIAKVADIVRMKSLWNDIGSTSRARPEKILKSEKQSQDSKPTNRRSLLKANALLD